MARRATGQVVEPRDGRAWALRFRAYGKRRYLTLGTTAEGWSRQRAEAELRHVLADVERGIWKPHEPDPVQVPAEIPTFHEFASEWLANRKPELRPRTIEDYEWALSHHLLPFFARHRLSEITVAEVDRYKTEKLREGKLGASQINKTLKRLAQVLEQAVDYELIPRNVAASKGGRRRVKEPKPQRAWVEPEQLLALLDCAPRGHRPILATMAGAGLRVGEAVALNWRDVNLADGSIYVRSSKTDAGSQRTVDLPNGLLHELRAHKAAGKSIGAEDPVFVTRGYQGGPPKRQTTDNVALRLKTAIRRANAKLEPAGIDPISKRVSPHALRRTFASLRAALHDDVVYIAEQGGWADPTFPLTVYARAVKRRDRLSGAHLEAFDKALEWAATGSGGRNERVADRRADASGIEESASISRILDPSPRSSAG